MLNKKTSAQSMPNANHKRSKSRTYSQRVHRHAAVKNRYEVLHLASSVLSSVLFLAGSLCMFYKGLGMTASVLFILGSIQMLLRSLISLAYRIYMKRHIELYPSSFDR